MSCPEREPLVAAISGVKNSGKTTLIERLIPRLLERGISVATVKHDGHCFEAERPGTDSFRHLQAGALGSAVFDGEKFQLVKRTPVDENTLIGMFPEADLILLEGFKSSVWPKVEIVRRGNSSAPVCDPSTLLALVTALEMPSAPCPVLAPEDDSGLAGLLERFVKTGRSCSGIILAGGYSSRMGRCKAELPFGGVRMIEHQVRKLRMLGIEDILIAGYEPEIAGARFVPDVYPHRGPLSGIHAGLAAARCERALVVSVDAPLLPMAALSALMQTHEGGVTALTHGGQLEPLLAGYDRALAPLCGEILQGERSSVRQLFDRVGLHEIDWQGDGLLLSNCNTPEEYEKLCAISQVQNEICNFYRQGVDKNL